MKQIGSRGGTLVSAARMKQFAIAGLLVAALTLSSVALAGGTLAGKYQTTIKSPAEFTGTWVLSLAKNGTYTAAGSSHVLVRGKYSATGSKITFGHESGDGACPKSGTYSWKKTGKTLKFTRISESAACSGRAGILAHTFTQKG